MTGVRLAGRRLRVLVLTWNYPTPAAPQRGLWAQRMCDAAAQAADVTVIVPTPWVPPFVPLPALSRFRGVPAQIQRGEVDVYFPRVPGSIEYLTHDRDARLALSRVLALARRLHESKPFDVIHAHFIYPDGVVAAHVGRALGVPVMTSEHSFWTPWLADRRRVGEQVAGALPDIRLVTAVSETLRSSIEDFTRGAVETEVLPNVVDDEIFFPADTPRHDAELLYVGLIRRVKRLDVLLCALAEARKSMPSLHLRILSANAYRAYGSDRREVRRLISALGLDEAVHVVHGTEPRGVADAMRRAAFVTVTSARETFCSVAAEALACGTPVIATRCGGPEEFVSMEDGVLVPLGDPIAYAAAIREAFARRSGFDSATIASRIVDRFGRAAWTERAMTLYERVAARRPAPTGRL
jgi:teichuronic acid biosynthesis glycosyltransferase TuaC